MTDTQLLDWIALHKADITFTNAEFGSYVSIRFDVCGRILTVSERNIGDALRAALTQAIEQERQFLKKVKRK